MPIIDERTITLECDVCKFKRVFHEKLSPNMRREKLVLDMYGWKNIDGLICCPKHRANIELLINVLLSAGKEDIEKPDVPERKMKQIRIF